METFYKRNFAEYSLEDYKKLEEIGCSKGSLFKVALAKKIQEILACEAGFTEHDEHVNDPFIVRGVLKFRPEQLKYINHKLINKTELFKYMNTWNISSNEDLESCILRIYPYMDEESKNDKEVITETIIGNLALLLRKYPDLRFRSSNDVMIRTLFEEPVIQDILNGRIIDKYYQGDNTYTGTFKGINEHFGLKYPLNDYVKEKLKLSRLVKLAEIEPRYMVDINNIWEIENSIYRYERKGFIVNGIDAYCTPYMLNDLGAFYYLDESPYIKKFAKTLEK